MRGGKSDAGGPEKQLILFVWPNRYTDGRTYIRRRVDVIASSGIHHTVLKLLKGLCPANPKPVTATHDQ